MLTWYTSTTERVSRQRGVTLLAKRVIDVVGAAVLLLAVSPLLLVTAVAVKLDSPGPVLFRSTRLGRGARPFTMLKFRSMVADADPAIHRAFIASLLREDGEARAGGCYKLDADPRVTRVGRLIRRLSVDELPQLVNVLRGDMSLVGPRPEVPYALEGYERWQWRRFDVLPGMTGLWQASGRGTLSPREMLRLDAAYVEGFSLWLDVKLLFKTVLAVLTKVGSA